MTETRRLYHTDLFAATRFTEGTEGRKQRMTANENAVLTLEKRWGIRVVERADAGKAVPPGKIPALLAAEPNKGLFELERATFGPSVPSKTIRKILSDAFSDARIAPDTKAELLWRYNHVPAFRDAVLLDCKGDIPFCLLDSEDGRRWYCERKMPDYEVVRCSSPVFFQRIREIDPTKWEEGTIEKSALVRKAIDDNAPAQLVLALFIVGRKTDARLLHCLFRLGKMEMLDWLVANDDNAKEFLDERRKLFYACSNWSAVALAKCVGEGEKANPGIVRGCVDVFGRNLLWYTLANPCLSGEGDMEAVEKLLVRLGAEPNARTQWGVSWRNMRRAREGRGWEFELFVDGIRVIDGFGRKKSPTLFPRCRGSGHRVRIVQRGTGIASEWTLPKELFPAFPNIRSMDEGKIRHDKEGELSVWFWGGTDMSARPLGVKRVVFRRGHGGLFQLGDVEGWDWLKRLF